MLKGSDTEDEDFMFVTSTQYAKDKEDLQETINKTVKFNEDGSIEVPQIKYNDTIINIKEDGLYVGNEILANKSDVPVLITLTS
jgi:glutaredoxin